MTEQDLEQVYCLDKLTFGADRGYFLKRRLERFPELSLVMVQADKVTGFLLGRKGKDWVSAGPWIISSDAKDPIELLRSFAIPAGGRQISIGILESNQLACDLVRSLGFSERADSPWRMALGSSADLGATQGCFAVGSAAKG